ncbi:PspC domain-containing protein [Salinicoccus luteus]|uniref:PspC domain-containing protein n=1 Tax=Salinicoccus luteus TaxID=367840 RepID=UPI000A05EE7A|nr:PspC domain-containing protein [Salinicoccus luteus]
MNNKKLVRSSTDSYLMGVFGGLGEKIGIDSTILRIIFVVLTVATMNIFLVVLYFIVGFIMPTDDEIDRTTGRPNEPFDSDSF